MQQSSTHHTQQPPGGYGPPGGPPGGYGPPGGGGGYGQPPGGGYGQPPGGGYGQPPGGGYAQPPGGYGHGPGGFVPPMARPPGGGGNPADRVSLPATLMMVVAIISILWNVVALLLNILGTGFGTMFAGSAGDAFGQVFSGALGIVAVSVALLIDGFVIFGAMKMKKLESHALAVVAAVLCALPCSVCCIFNTPIGIWAVVVLLDQNVKAAFTS